MTDPKVSVLDSLPDGLLRGDDGRIRCLWAAKVPEFLNYHDTEWGFPVDDDHTLFEKICLEGFQSGLSWRTILNKRPAFREVFLNFDFEQVAGTVVSAFVQLTAHGLGDGGVVVP